MDGNFIINKENILYFLNSLWNETGGYAETPGSEANIRSTLSVIKAMLSLNHFKKPPYTAEYISSCHTVGGGFATSPSGSPTPYDTADALICLKNIGEIELLERYKDAALCYMSNTALNQYDHFMLVATYEELGIAEKVPETTIAYFSSFLDNSIKEGKITDIAIAAASILRAKSPLKDRKLIQDLLLKEQNSDGGFGENGISTLFSSYCILRTLLLLEQIPNIMALCAYLESLKTDFGFSDTNGGQTKASSTYIVLSIFEWIEGFQKIAVNMARQGDVAGITKWLLNGGNPDLKDMDGFTVLLAASAYGKSEVVDLLLNHKSNSSIVPHLKSNDTVVSQLGIKGAMHADPKIRYQAADALPIYLAGQNGDLNTIKLLLEACPDDIFAISSINGHTLLLQAAFYGTNKHLEVAKYILENIDILCKKPKEQKEDLQNKLLCATNVRGYTALSMQELWHNEAMKELLLCYYKKEAGKIKELEEMTQQYYNSLLLKIASSQSLTEQLLVLIQSYLYCPEQEVHEVCRKIDSVMEQPHFNINQLGGSLMMSPLIYTITCSNESDIKLADRCYFIAKKLLEQGADPCVYEMHPMGVGPVIRASVTNNFKLLKLLYDYMSDELFKKELNAVPPVNGLTAMHDAVHRALTSPPDLLCNHLLQIEWMLEKGAQTDLNDNTGQTAYELAKYALGESSGFPRDNAVKVWNVINKDPKT